MTDDCLPLNPLSLILYKNHQQDNYINIAFLKKSVRLFNFQAENHRKIAEIVKNRLAFDKSIHFLAHFDQKKLYYPAIMTRLSVLFACFFAQKVIKSPPRKAKIKNK
jgi:lipoate synthase